MLVALTLMPAGAAVRPPRMHYSIATLPNGLTVVLSEDHSTPIVHADLWYHVGSKDERPGRTGFAHLFEHMMFKGSKNVEPEEHASMIASVGGQSNAYTNDDTTVFWETVPSQYLPLILWLEADRMATLKIDEATFKAEREVVKEERRLRIDNQPFGRLSEILYANAFTRAPLQAHHDRQHGGPGRRVGGRRPRFPQHVLRAGQRDAGAGGRLRLGAGDGSGHEVLREDSGVGIGRSSASTRESRRAPARSA